jgi:hypothetical protein
MTIELPAGWRCTAQVELNPTAQDRRTELTQRLGQPPRRIGAWAELALLGALRCLESAGEAGLPASARLRLASLDGPGHAFDANAERVRQQLLPKPFEFMQSQPGHALALLSQVLRWQGDARFVIGRDRSALLRLALLECGSAGLLFGWVEQDRLSAWWRVVPD